MYVPVASLIIDEAEDFEICESFSCKCQVCDADCACAKRCTDLSMPLFECNQHCACARACPLKILEIKFPYKFVIKKTTGKGLGVFAIDFIPKGVYIGEYAGRVVDMDTQGKFVFQIRENTPSKVIVTTVDAGYFGNFTRFFNHSCEPNLEVRAIRGDYIIPHIGFFTIQDIRPNEELCFRYRENGKSERCLCNSLVCQGLY